MPDGRLGGRGDLNGCWDRRETGVDSALLPLSLRPAQLNPLGDGWPSRVRAVDAPA
jgi:hypothetical protein